MAEDNPNPPKKRYIHTVIAAVIITMGFMMWLTPSPINDFGAILILIGSMYGALNWVIMMGNMISES